MDDDNWVHTNLEPKDLLVKLGLATAPEAPEPKKKGCPKKTLSLVEVSKRLCGKPRVRPLPEPWVKKKPGRPKIL